MARALWSGSISFGLVNIPVKLFRATTGGKSISFHLLHDKCGTRIRNRRWCPHDDEPVEWNHIVKGYEISKGRYVKVDKSELDEILPKEDFAQVAIEGFVKLGEIDPLYFDTSYHSAPDGNARAYGLLLQAMEDAGKIAVARVILRTRSHLAALIPDQGQLLLTTLFYQEELAALPAIPELHVDKRQLAMASQLIDSMAMKWDPAQYHDEYAEKVQKLIEEKLEGGEVTTELGAPEEGKVVDLMEALKKSVAGAPRPAARRRLRRGSRTRPRPARASKR
jgi:DNA end-binding protein Ku